jgi:DNA-directed RNA polymerase specialized sigma24 family protein
MDPESLRTITTSAITALSTLAGAAIVAYFGYRTQKHTRKTDELERQVEEQKKELRTAYRQVSSYYQLEEKYSEQIATMTGQAQKTVKSQFRDAVQEEGFDRPKWTSLECEKAISDSDLGQPRTQERAR